MKTYIDQWVYKGKPKEVQVKENGLIVKLTCNVCINGQKMVEEISYKTAYNIKTINFLLTNPLTLKYSSDHMTMIIIYHEFVIIHHCFLNVIIFHCFQN